MIVMIKICVSYMLRYFVVQDWVVGGGGGGGGGHGLYNTVALSAAWFIELVMKELSVGAKTFRTYFCDFIFGDFLGSGAALFEQSFLRFL